MAPAPVPAPVPGVAAPAVEEAAVPSDAGENPAAVPLPPDCPLPARVLCRGHFSVHSTQPVTHIPEEFPLDLVPVEGKAGSSSLGVQGKGQNVYGQFTLSGHVALPGLHLTLLRCYEGEKVQQGKKVRRPKPKPAALQVSERRVSHRITSGVRKTPFFPDSDDELTGRLPVTPSNSFCPAAKLLGAVDVSSRPALRTAFVRWCDNAGVVRPPAPAPAPAEEGVKSPPKPRRRRSTSEASEGDGDGPPRGKRPRLHLQASHGSQQSGPHTPRHLHTPRGRARDVEVDRSDDPPLPRCPQALTENWVPAFMDEAGETYEGEMVKGLRHGLGICVYANSYMYQGQWKRGREHGRGKLMTGARKVIYEGDWADGKMNGKGRYHFQSGGLYEGDMRENMRHGSGKYHLAGGYVYDGEWREDTRWGYGVFTWPSGSAYEGEWVRGLKHGRGHLRWCNGFVYTGHWIENKMEGRGYVHRLMMTCTHA
jgi:hypothetical protein